MTSVNPKARGRCRRLPRATILHVGTLLSKVDLALSLLTTPVNGFVVYLFVLQGLFRRFLFLSLYFLLSVTISIAWWVTPLHFAFSSIEYG